MVVKYTNSCTHIQFPVLPKNIKSTFAFYSTLLPKNTFFPKHSATIPQGRRNKTCISADRR
ncbi:hypothetical protein OA84_09200 [Kaistella solincola]|uniref:Uncharacterized protein n=1 Tax=Kaistella solincola TaxID=510955 RepID=A0ABR4ZSB2_9FLAO|nr:hypothetical protein OA84_09200 [Kaistella solincola]